MERQDKYYIISLYIIYIYIIYKNLYTLKVTDSWKNQMSRRHGVTPMVFQRFGSLKINLYFCRLNRELSFYKLILSAFYKIVCWISMRYSTIGEVALDWWSSTSVTTRHTERTTSFAHLSTYGAQETWLCARCSISSKEFKQAWLFTRLLATLPIGVRQSLKAY